MVLAEHAELLGPDLFGAIERKGYADLTAVQLAVLDPALAGRDLRITSQTGSGKTLAIGLTLRGLAGQEAPANGGVARPRALVVAPTRELAHQVEEELTWLYAQSGIRLATTTGGASYRDEHRALAKGPSIVVGTPGRLLDHLQRGSIDASEVTTVVLDEADRMLDLGFRDDLEQLFKSVPKERSTHLVSATFPRMVRSLADRLQRDPAHVEGTRLGAANADIDHVIHVVDPSQRLDALINLLLAYPEDQTLVFVRTRADAAHIANELVVTGFAASALSGEMEQAARNRALAAFRHGGLRVLIATDVAARGIDVVGVSRVVHGELPTNADAYTHRSGRTGRAGRKGTSSLLVAPVGVVRASRLLRGLGIDHRFESIPSADEILSADDERLFNALTADETLAGADQALEASEGVDRARAEAEARERWQSLASRLIEAGDVEKTLVRLLAQARRGVTSPRHVRVFPERNRREEASPAFPSKHRDRGARPARMRDDARPARTRDDARSHWRDRPYEAPANAAARPDRPRIEHGVRADRKTSELRPDRADQKPSDVQAERTERKPSDVRPERAERKPSDVRPERAERKPSEVRPRATVLDESELEKNAFEANGRADVTTNAVPLSRDEKRQAWLRERAARVGESESVHERESENAPTPARDKRHSVRERVETREPRAAEPRSRSARGADRTESSAPREAAPDFTSFHVSWGQRDGADPRRLLAMLCRRGKIRGRDVGAIRVEGSYSLVQVANAVAPAFARAASEPDVREPEIVIRPDRAQSAEDLSATRTKLRVGNPFHRKGPSKARTGGQRPPARTGGQRPPKRHKAKAR